MPIEDFAVTHQPLGPSGSEPAERRGGYTSHGLQGKLSLPKIVKRNTLNDWCIMYIFLKSNC